MAGQPGEGGEDFRGAGAERRQTRIGEAGGPELRQGDDGRRRGGEFPQSRRHPVQIGVDLAEDDIELEKGAEAGGQKFFRMQGLGRQDEYLVED